MGKTFFLGCLLTCLWHGMMGQKVNIDSLKMVLRSSKEDTARVSLLNKLAYGYTMTVADYKTAMEYLNEAELLARKLNYSKELVTTYCYKGLIFDYQGKHEEALKEFDKGLVLA